MSNWGATMPSRANLATVRAGCLLSSDHSFASDLRPSRSSPCQLSRNLRLPGVQWPASSIKNAPATTRVTVAALPSTGPSPEDTPPALPFHVPAGIPHQQLSAPCPAVSPTALAHGLSHAATAHTLKPKGRSIAAVAVALAIALGGGVGLVRPPPALAKAAAAAPAPTTPASSEARPMATASAAAVNEKVVSAGEATGIKSEAASIKSEAAEKRILAELDKNPKHEGMLRALLRLRMEREDLKGSIEPLERLTEIRPDDIELAMILGQAQIAMHNLPAAGEAFQKVLAADPFNPAALQGSVAILQHANKGQEAVALLRETLAKAEAVAAMAAPTSQERRLQTELVVGVKLVLGQVLVSQGDLEAACLEYNDCVKAVPNDFRPYLSLGFVHQLSGNTKKADEQFAKCKALCPPNYREVVDQLVSAAQKGVKIEHALKNKVK